MKIDNVRFTSNMVWPITHSHILLGELSRMEIAIWGGKLAAFDYAKRRGTRNMLNPPHPILEAPRGRTKVSAHWDASVLYVDVACEGREEGERPLRPSVRFAGLSPPFATG